VTNSTELPSDFFTNLLAEDDVKATSLRELYIQELKDLYDAENQITKALPKMMKESSSDELRSALEEHLEVTKEQARRIEQIFSNMGERLKAEKCKGVEGVIKEGSELLKEAEDEDVRDAGIIASAQKVEHYEIASYGTVRTYAQLLGEDEAARLLQQTLEEEKEADQKLNGLAEEINVEAGGEEVEERPARRSASRTSGRRTGGRSRRAA
jgi:ferritin-like metal-binding protein YciE